ncbi:hypothetical protein GOP47_0018676 [Adiantum capillus-veneris]|uniref:NADH:flavin oxidoreductase/NADH oxidase N-terminal domain-containing protein n=1 Tax=Adiantum capillus-veneris TaxID=13818 RepID=A0A9D4Z9V4_ADICA|nr:hypothetical protein GOP47_0018676 [Adiantum capillus-veneris]
MQHDATPATSSPLLHQLDVDNNIFNSLLAPVDVAEMNLSHRVVFAPVTRCRALNYCPQEGHAIYYSQRATEGGLLITEAVAISQEGIGFPHSPGIWTQEQVEQWRNVVRAVHDEGGYIFCQIWHVGRASHTHYQPESECGKGLSCGPVSSTAQRIPKQWLIRLPEGVRAEYSQPRALRTHEIPFVVDQFRHAARNAIQAGFDGVEIHGAHGYLIDQFLKDTINDREDEYGGSIENRCRFALEVMSAVVSEIGGQKTAMRISPVIDHLGAYDSDPIQLGLHLISHLNDMKLAYLHITEPRMTNKGLKSLTITNGGRCKSHVEDESLQLFKKAFKGRVMLSGGYTRETGMHAIKSGAADMISFGRLFLANPDLPLRFAIRADLNEGDESTYYTHDQVKGYLDYPLLTPLQVEQGYNRAGTINNLDHIFAADQEKKKKLHDLSRCTCV